MSARTTLSWLALLCLAPMVSCGADEGTGPGGSGPASVVRIRGDGQTAEVGTSLPTNPAVELRDASGDPVANETVEFSVTSGGGSVSTASTSSDSRGRASVTWTLGPSSSANHTLQVTAGSATVTFTAEAVPGPPVEARAVDGNHQVGDPGSTLPDPLVARVVDRFGNGVPEVTVTFRADAGGVSPSEVATDSAGRAATTATVATLDELGDQVSVIPVSLDRARRTLDYEQSLSSARSTGFSAGAGGAGSVEFQAHVPSGEDAAWRLSAGTSLPSGLSLSSGGLISGTPEADGAFEFTVEADEPEGGTGTRTYTLRICEAPLQLSPGEVLAAAPPPAGRCGLFLPSGSDGDRYRVAVVWPSSVRNPADPTATLRVRGHDVASTTAPPPVAAARRSAPSFAVSAERLRRDLERMEATGELHRRLLGEGALLSARLGPGAALPDRSTGRGSAAAGPAEAHGRADTREFNAPVNSCTTATTIRAQLLVESEDMLVYQDSAQHASTEERVDTTLARRMTDYYGSYGKQVIDDYFGGVADIDDNGKVIVLIAPAPLIDRDDALAFVLSRDFFSAQDCAGSNEAEITYFSADGINAMESGADPQSFQALGALVHEVKHISSFHNRIQSGDLADRPSWIEEGTADIAAELSSRIAWSETGGPAPDGRVTGESFTENPGPESWGIFLRMARTVSAWSSQPNSLTNNPVRGHSFRGSSWHFHRFLADAYAGGIPADSAFFRRQNARSADPGVGFYQSDPDVGTTYPELVEAHAGAAMVNGTSADGSMERSFAGYEFPSAAEIFCSPNPLGVYPWPITTTGSREQGQCTTGYSPDFEVQNPSAPFATDRFEGPLGRGGMRVHDFVSDGTGLGAELNVDVESPARDQVRVIVVRLR